MSAPTILIGLGGIGSQVVEEVYKKIPPERRDHITIHAFDTNVNDIEKRGYLAGRITQISKPIKVKHYLKRDRYASEWFPHEYREVREKPATEGAGQVRAISRLVYRAAMSEGKLSKLKNQVSEIFRARGESAVSSVRVMIVCSLGGGTGAGTFLQTALYLRELLEGTFGKNAVMVRGAFMLPNILVNTQTVPESQYQNVQANAYACMKELDAMVRRVALDNDGDTGDGDGGLNDDHQPNMVNIEFEYRPNQVDLEGHKKDLITSDHLPYDFCILYDYQNDNGENIGAFESYLRQMTNTVYMQLFSPFSGKYFSIEDNFILDLVKHGVNRYCGAGTASLVYPYEDIMEYCTLRWGEVSLSDEWRKVDEDLEQEIRTYERDIQNNVQREKLDLIKRYVELVDNYGGPDASHPFFTEIYRSARILNEQGREIGTKARIFLEAVEKKIEQVLNADRDLKRAEERCKVDAERLQRKKEAPGQVAQMENGLETLKRLIFRKIPEHKNFLLNQILGEDCFAPNCLGSDDDFRLNTWMLARPEPLHPVAVRYVLGQLSLGLKTAQSRLLKEKENATRAIDDYAKRYDLSDTERVETALERVEEAAERGGLLSVFNNDFKDFIKFYKRASSDQKNLLIQFKKIYLKEMVMGELAKAVGAMLQLWEQFFRNLREVRNSLNIEVNTRAMEHESLSDTNYRFLLAKEEDKKYIWEKLRLTLTYGKMLPEEAARGIYVGRFKAWCKSQGRGNEGFLLGTGWDDPETVEETFRQDVLSGFRDVLRKDEWLNMDVIRALMTEADQMGVNHADYIRQEIDKLDNLARPFVQLDVTDASAVHQNYFEHWGLNPTSLKNIPSGLKSKLFPNGLVEDEAFSKYELIRYRNLVGFKAEYLSDFRCSDEGLGDGGSYYTSYKKRINALEAGERTVTPHLDKRWHLPAYMPDLNKNIMDLDRRRTDWAFLWGVIYRYLKRTQKQGGQWTWDFNSRKGRELSSPIKIPSRRVKGTFTDLYSAMFYNPAIRDRIMELATERRSVEIEKDKLLTDHELYINCLNLNTHTNEDDVKVVTILDALVTMIGKFPGDSKSAEWLLLSFLNDIVVPYFSDHFDSTRTENPKTEAASFVRIIEEQSELFRQAEKTRSGAYGSWRAIIDNFLDEMEAGG